MPLEAIPKQYPFSVSIVAPMFNEAGSIVPFLQRLQTVLNLHFKQYEIILVDDGSTDETLLTAKMFSENDPRIRILAFSRNYGHEIALTAGIEHARGDWAVQLDSDLQHPPELIPVLLEKALEGYDIVYAARTHRDNETWFKKISAKLFYRIAKKMSGFDLPDNAGNFRVLNRKVVNSLKMLRENNRHLLMLYAYVGFKSAAVPFDVSQRHAGKSKYNYAKLFNLAVDSIISFSSRPLRYMSLISVFISIILAFYAGFIVLQKLFSANHLIDGMASLIFIMSGLFAILFLFLAVISEYIGRILIETKHRPLYYIREFYGTGLPQRDDH